MSKNRYKVRFQKDFALILDEPWITGHIAVKSYQQNCSQHLDLHYATT